MNHHTPHPTPQSLCALFEPLLPLLSQDQLSASEAVATRHHVMTCAWCQLQLRDFDFLRDALRRLDTRDAQDMHVSHDGRPSSYRSLTREDIHHDLQEDVPEDVQGDLAHMGQQTSIAAAPPPVRAPDAPGRAGRFSSLAAIAAVLLIAALTGAIFVQFAKRNGAPRQGATTTIGTVSATIYGLGTMAPDTQHSGRSHGAYGMTANDSTVWVHNGDSGLLLRVDMRTNSIVAQIGVGHGEGGVAIGEGGIWVANPYEGTVSRINPQTNSLVATIPLGLQAYRVATIATSPGAVWVTDIYNETLIRIDPQRNEVVARLTPDSFNQAAAHGPIGVSFGAGSVWLCEQYSPALGLTRLTPQGDQIQAQVALAGGSYGTYSCSAVMALDQAIWTLSFNSLWSSTFPTEQPNTVLLTHIDPATNRVIATSLVTGASPYHFAADARGVWLLVPQEGLIRVDPQANRELGRMALAGAAGVTAGGGALWVANAQTGALLRITPAPG
jgi:streptogramin lyase